MQVIAVVAAVVVVAGVVFAYFQRPDNTDSGLSGTDAGMRCGTTVCQGIVGKSVGKDLVEPATVQSETLIQGNGLQVKDGSYILVNYKAVRWKDGSEYASSWPEDKAPLSTQIGAGQLIPALDEALLDQTTGSQVLVVAPPQFGYPDEGTLVFVVDILDVWTPVD